MELSVKNLIDFIFDFGLYKTGKAIYFSAVIEYRKPGEIKKTESEVHIITSGNLATIYFLSPEIEAERLRDMFDARKEKIVYEYMRCLKIELDDSSIIIYPKIGGI